jgi:hypothetical protein
MGACRNFRNLTGRGLRPTSRDGRSKGAAAEDIQVVGVRMAKVGSPCHINNKG